MELFLAMIAVYFACRFILNCFNVATYDTARTFPQLSLGAFYLLCFIGAVLLATLMLSPKSHAATLEVPLATSTKYGVQFDEVHGCYEYGLFVQAATREKNDGRTLESHLQGLSDTAEIRQTGGANNIAGMEEFLRTEIKRIHSSVTVSPETAGTVARTICRSAHGATWQFARKGV